MAKQLTLVGRISGKTSKILVQTGQTARQLFEAIDKPEYADGEVSVDGVVTTPDAVVPVGAKTVLSAEQLKGN